MNVDDAAVTGINRNHSKKAPRVRNATVESSSAPRTSVIVRIYVQTVARTNLTGDYAAYFISDAFK